MSSGILKTPQDHIVKSNYSGSAGEEPSPNQITQINRITPITPIEQTGESQQKFFGTEQEKLLALSMGKKHNKTSTNQHAVYQNAKKRNLVHQHKSKYFTFDGNSIFNPKNPVSPARGHLATIFVRQKIGREKYEKVLQLLSESDDPVKLLDISPEEDLSEKQKQILSLINDDRNFLSIFQYIVNCSYSSKNSNNSNYMSQNSYGTVTPNSSVNTNNFSK